LGLASVFPHESGGRSDLYWKHSTCALDTQGRIAFDGKMIFKGLKHQTPVLLLKYGGLYLVKNSV
jgi:hypothetical protein